MKELPKVYEPKQYEDDIYKRWEDSGFFAPKKRGRKVFSMVLPPPNETGTLHMGHAVMLAIQDCLIRYHRMKGERTLWVPGTDHAAIATQAKVEDMIWKEEKKTRHDLGREELLRRIKTFAKQSHDTIIAQCKKMGASLDWSREAYTLDERRNLAVRTMFKMMYYDGIIYRGDRIVNWDPAMQSNVSDDEIEWKEEQAPFYYFRYGPFEIGTARPETKFGDKYVVMHPKDDRYKKYTHGDKLTVEWLNGPIQATIIKDEAVDMAFGTGVMTITPWHDATDFEIAERHGLEKQQIVGYDGKLLDIAGEFSGMTIAEARPKIVEKLKTKGLLSRMDEKYVHRIAANYRGGGVIEPQIRKQWFVGVNKEFRRKGRIVTLKKLMHDVVKNGDIDIIPDRFNKTYFHWIDNLRDWCISRQIWYGHRIPVWYKGDEAYCEVDAPKGDGWEQDPDTLDTWFSSGLWTFSALGWPKKTKDLKTYHPTSVLETGYDILFFWVARMILMSTYALGDIPFRTVYLHGLVRDEQGRKMSKSLNNIINPLDMIEKYGTDATRLSLVIGSTPGNDTKLSEAKIAGFRNFTNKLWNISRFMLLNIEQPKADADKPEPKTLADKWILQQLEIVTYKVNESFKSFDFSFAGESLREFTWNDLADWYLEIAKIEKNKSNILNVVLNQLLTLWHPFIPFVTEAIWQEVYGDKRFLMVEHWPHSKSYMHRRGFNLTFLDVQRIITRLRTFRSDYHIEPTKRLRVIINGGSKESILRKESVVIKELGRLEDLVIEKSIQKPKGTLTIIESGVEIFIEMAGIIDRQKEKIRLQKEIGGVAPYVASMEKKLSNDQFVKNAPSAVIEAERIKLKDAKEKAEKLQGQLKRFV